MSSLLKIASTISDSSIKARLEKIAIDLVAAKAGIDPAILSQLKSGYKEIQDLVASEEALDGSDAKTRKWIVLASKLANMPTEMVPALQQALLQIGRHDPFWRRWLAFKMLSLLVEKCSQWAKTDPGFSARFTNAPVFARMIKDRTSLQNSVQNIQNEENANQPK